MNSLAPFLMDLRTRFRPLVFLVFGLLWAWPLALDPGGIPFAPRAEYSDLLVAHWPNAEYSRHALRMWGEWPLWNRWRFAGMPFAADPLAGLWYPPNALLLVLPLARAFNILLLLHLAWGGWGMHRFLRSIGCSPGASLLGGVLFSGAPKLIAHLGAGHVSLVQSMAWMPWLMLSARSVALDPSWRRGVFAGALFALAFLTDVRGAFYAGLLAGAYGAWTAFVHQTLRPIRRALNAGAAILTSSACLSAPLLLPMLELLPRTSRVELNLTDMAAFSLPVAYLLGALIPDLGGFHEWMVYSGLAVLALAGAAVAAGLRKGEWFWPAAVVLAWLLSFGDHTPLFRLVVAVPGVSLLRVPPRAMFYAAFALAVLAALGADRLGSDLDARMKRRLSRFMAGGLGFAIMLGVAIVFVTRGPAPNVTGMLLVASLVLALMGLRLGGRLSGARWLFLFGTLAVGDLIWVNSTLLETRPLHLQRPTRDAVQFLLAQPGEFRVYSPSYSLPHEAAAQGAIEQVDGVNPMQLDATAEYFLRASGVGAEGYNITLPPLGNDPKSHNRGAVPDAELLGLLNVQFVLAEFDLDAPGLTPVERFGDTRVYENVFARGEAWLEAGEGGNPIPSVARTANRVAFDVETAAPALLVTSEMDYPGWVATVDGNPAPIVRVHGVLRGVRLDTGTHRVEFAFRPAVVVTGVALFAVGMVLVALAAAQMAGRKRQTVNQAIARIVPTSIPPYPR